ncbi:hypothetical protein vseg_000841 [Gypsophila vaccaria]
MLRKRTSKHVEAPSRLLRSTTDKAVFASPMKAVLGDFMGIPRQPVEPVPTLTSVEVSLVVPLVTSSSQDGCTIPPIPVEPVAPVAKVPIPTETKKFSNILWSTLKGMAMDFIPKCSETVTIGLDDVKDELDYWSTTLVGTVLGRRVSLA